MQIAKCFTQFLQYSISTVLSIKVTYKNVFIIAVMLLLDKSHKKTVRQSVDIFCFKGGRCHYRLALKLTSLPTQTYKLSCYRLNAGSLGSLSPPSCLMRKQKIVLICSAVLQGASGAKIRRMSATQHATKSWTSLKNTIWICIIN